MKEYDFTNVINRSNTGSMKWREMEGYSCPADVIPFSVADMEFRNMPEVVDGLKSFLDNGVLGYANPTQEYKETVRQWMLRHHDYDIDTEWIIDTPGVINAFFTAVHAFTEPGDSILLTTPIYYPMYMAAERNGRNVAATSLINDNGTYHIDFADFERKAKDPKVKLFILCSPHNPCSRVWTREELETMGRICIENDVLICSDEIHSDLLMPGYRHTVFSSISEEFAVHSIICTAPSKTFNLAGLQTSNAIIPDKDIREAFATEMRKHDGNPKCNILGLEACRLAYAYGDEWLRQVIGHIDNNRRTIEEYLKAELPMIKVTPLEGTYLLWMDFRALGIEPKKLGEILKKEAHLFFDDGYVFGKEGEGFERWNLACPESYILPALDRLRGAIRKHI